MLKHTAVLMIILCISQNSFGLLEDPNRERFQDRQLLADDKFGRESLKTSPYIRDVRADSRQSRIDASDIRTDFREIRTELHKRFSRDSREAEQVRARVNRNRENTRQMGRADERSSMEETRVRSSQHPEATREAERFAPESLDSSQRRYSENPLLRTSATRCSRRMSFEETQPPTSDRRRELGDRERRSAEDRTMETRSSSRRALERREIFNRRTRAISERLSPNSRHLERLNQETDKNRRNQPRTLLQRDNINRSVGDLVRTRRIIHEANVEQRERQQRTFRNREESRKNSPDFENTRRLINQRRVREINLQRARNLESMRFANRHPNLQERRRFERLNNIQTENRHRDLNEESRVNQRRETGSTNDERTSFKGRFAENRRNPPIGSRNVEREGNMERVVGNTRAQSEEAAIYSKARNTQFNQPSEERRVVDNALAKTETRSNQAGYNRIASDSRVSKLVDFPAQKGKYNTWMNVAETLLVLALIGQVIGGTSKGKVR